MRKTILTMFIALATLPAMRAQSVTGNGQELVGEVCDSFNPHWFVQAQGGAAHSLGEASFGKLISPTLQVAAGYKFNQLFALRLSASGWQAKNRYNFPRLDYKWNYVQPNLDAMLDLSNLFCGWNPRRVFNAYTFVGGGVAFCFNNDDAVRAQRNIQHMGFQKLWDGTKLLLSARGGIGADFRISKRIYLGLEVNANVLPDKFNSKKGKNDNVDWQFNGLAGIKILLGKTQKHNEAIYEPAPPAPKARCCAMKSQATAMQQTVSAAKAKPESKTVCVFFKIGKSDINITEISKLLNLATFMNDNPEITVNLTGYADKQTGNKRVNLRLSQERAARVKAFLESKGVASSRITTNAKGDLEQPFDTPKENRVTLAITQ